MKIVLDENRQRHGNVDEHGEQIGEAETQHGPIDTRRSEAARPRDRQDHERVADAAGDEDDTG